MKGFLATCLCLGLAWAGWEGSPVIADPPLPDFKPPDYKKKPLRDWLQAMDFLEGSRVGTEAREALDQYSIRVPDAVPRLIDALRDKDEIVRRGAAETLRRRLRWNKDDRPVAALLCAAKEDPSARVRAEAAYALGAVLQADEKAVAAALRIIREDKDGDVRARAIEGLEEACRDSREWKEISRLAEPVFIQALADKDPNVRVQAAWALYMPAASPAVTPALLEALKDDDREVHKAVCRTLVAGAPKNLPELLKGLRHKDAIVRAEVALALAGAIFLYRQVPPKEAGPLLPVLTPLLKNEDPLVRERAVQALGYISQGPGQVVSALLEALEDKDVRRAVQALEYISKESGQAVPALLEALGDKEVRVRLEAADILGLAGSEAIPALLRAAKDPSPAVRSRALRSLDIIGWKTEEMVPVLVEVLKDPESSVRWEAANLLGGLGRKAKPAIPALREALKDPKLQGVAAESLTRIDPAAAAEAGVFTILVADVGPYLKDPNAPQWKGPLSFSSTGWVAVQPGQNQIEARGAFMQFNWLTMGYVLRGRLDPKKVKPSIPVKELEEVAIRYTDDWLEIESVKEKDIEGLIQDLYKPDSKAVMGLTIIPGGEMIEFSMPMKKLIHLGEKARPAVQKRLGDPAIQNEVAYILGAIGDASSVAALIEAYPEVDRSRKVAGTDDPAVRDKIVAFIYALTYLTGQPIGRTRAGTDYDPNNRRLWKEWWARAKKDFRVSPDKERASWVPNYPDLTPQAAASYRKQFLERDLPFQGGKFP